MNIRAHHPAELVDEMHRHLIQNILRAIQEIRFGSVEIVIHDSKVVQIERKEKIRIDQNSSRPT
ncbi:MAG TPA: YezD family protein [Nitrospiraceae bacterium]|nr:YezD family protein [Nitrospiraceae bacterium]